MKAIVLAAGKGTRLGGLTADVPKPMLDLNGKPLLEYIINYLKSNGIVEIGINLFTMAEQITDYFGDGQTRGVSLCYSHETELRGTAGSLIAFKDWLAGESTFLVIYGDILTNQPIRPLLELHNQADDTFATLLLHRRKSSNSFVQLDSQARMIDFIERPGEAELRKLQQNNPNGFLVNSAVQLLDASVLDFIESNGSFDLPRDVYAKMYKEARIHGVELTGERIAIDSPERYHQAVDAIRNGVFQVES
jgi:NDP-sugar pyrophosphorylase family protein